MLDRVVLFLLITSIVVVSAACSLFHDTKSVLLEAPGECDSVDCGDWTCGSSRSECGILDCGSCTNGLHCDSVEHTCTSETCDPETDEELCTRLQIECGLLDVRDNCGVVRLGVNCGECSEGNCTGAPEYLCTCDQLDRSQICTDGVCGKVKNGCVDAIEDCGGCSSATQQCIDNICCVPNEVSDDTICSYLDRECGPSPLPASCDPNREVDCGACAAEEICVDGACCVEKTCLGDLVDYCGPPIEKQCGEGVLDCSAGCTTAVAAGARHVCALSASGEVRCWGETAFMKLGSPLNQPEESFVVKPTLVPGLQTSFLVATGEEHSCVVGGSGSGEHAISCWGRNVSGQLGRRADGGEPAMIDADVLVGRINNLDLGKEHSCAIVEGTIFCWGANGSGQLGSVGVTRSETPLQIPAISGATSVGTGEEHTCAIAAQGAVYCWGSNLEGQVGLTLSNIGDDFHEINLPYGASAKLAVGDNFTCATDEEHIYCWGSNEFAQLGTNPVDLPSSPSPRKIALGSGICERAGLIGSDTQAKCVTQIAAGRAHACFIDVGGRVYCWGRLSTGAESFQTQPTPRLVPGLSGSIRSISCGDGFTCAINTENRLQCWGNTAFGKLGRADFNSSGPGEVEFWQ